VNEREWERVSECVCVCVKERACVCVWRYSSKDLAQVGIERGGHKVEACGVWGV
jgi:hypothetical protein